MDLFPLWNSLRIAGAATVLTYLLGILLAYYVAKTPRIVKGVLDCILTLPMVLPPTVVGFFLLKFLGPRGALGSLFALWDARLIMKWYSAIFAAAAVSFPLMYRTVRGAFEAMDQNLIHAAKTLGMSNFQIFRRVRMPACRQGILAGTVLSFARALGEYGATSMVSGYTPGRTATVSTTVYQLWREGNDELAYQWVLINLAISFVVLVAVNLLESRYKVKGSKEAAK